MKLVWDYGVWIYNSEENVFFLEKLTGLSEVKYAELTYVILMI
jgi:hypothetical protein